MKKRLLTAALAACTCGILGTASAAEFDLKAVMSPQQQMQLDFADGTHHFLLMVRREGKAVGTGPLAGANVTEFGYHDIIPGASGDPRGYLVLALANGDTAYVKWRVRAVFVPGADGKPRLLDNGFWEIAGATGKLTGLKGAGTLHIRAVNATDREFKLTGELVQK